MFGECHAHIIMDGINYKKAIMLHKNSINEASIREHFEAYERRRIRFVRDGGDCLGVSRRANQIAAEYGIDYRSPVFAIHHNGHYGSIVGKGYDTLGMAVMSHTNGVFGVQAAVKAGVDSVEHGNYMDEETIYMLAESQTVWVPTLVTIRNLSGDGRYEQEVLEPIIRQAEKNLKLAYDRKVKVALGSDAGAYRVLHGKGLEDEYQAFLDILGPSEEVISWLKAGEKKIRETFKRPQF